MAFLWREADHCADYQKIINRILDKSRWSDLHATHPGKVFKHVWRELSIHETGLIVIDNIIVPPFGCRKKIIELLHIGHCGINKSIQLAKERFYWPGMISEIRSSVEDCKKCLALRKSQQREKQETQKAKEPMSHIGSDIFEYKQKKCIVITDRYSSYVICKKLPIETAAAVLQIYNDIFLILGRPQKLRSDRGTQYFAKETRQYCQDNFIDPEFSSTSNGLSESAVKEQNIY